MKVSHTFTEKTPENGDNAFSACYIKINGILNIYFTNDYENIS